VTIIINAPGERHTLFGRYAVYQKIVKKSGERDKTEPVAFNIRRCDEWL
jgi:hypothetical protein